MWILFTCPISKFALMPLTPLCKPIRVKSRLLWVGRDERGSDRESARSGRTGGRAGHQHRPGQDAARMEIRPDRFKAVAGKTLGKIHRYTHISDIFPTPPLTFRPIFTRLLRIVLLCGTQQSITLLFPILIPPTSNSHGEKSFLVIDFNWEKM